MAADFNVVYVPDDVIVQKATKLSATVIEAGDMVALSSDGIIIKAVATSTRLGYAVEAAASGATTCNVISDSRAIFSGSGDAVFSVAIKGTEVDLVGTTTLLVDVGASSTDVFKVNWSTDAGTAGVTAGIQVRINKTF